MGLLSFRNKKKQDGAHVEPGFKSRQDEAPPVARSRGKERKERTEREDHSNEPADPILPEKKRARRRLMGAIALVVAVVIGLPMVLDSEPKPLADDIVIKIPSRDKAAPASQSVPAPALSPAPAKMPASAQVTPAPATASLAATLDPKEVLVETAKPAGSTSVADVKGDSMPAAADDVKAAEIKPAESKPTEPKPTDVAPIKPVANAVSVVDSAARANQEVAAEARKAEAKKAELKIAELKKAELKAAENKAAEAKAVALKQAAEAKAEKVVVQVAALATTEKINEVLAKLKSAGIQSYSQKVTTDAGERTRIRIVTASRADAEKMRARLASIGLAGAAVVPAN